MNQSSRDHTLLDVRPSPGPGRGAVSPQSSRDKRTKRSLPGSTVRREGRAISAPVKVRLGIGAGPSRGDPDTASLVDGCEARGIDSLWFPDRIAAPTPEPLIALGWAAGRTRSLKLGTGVVVLPGRNPAIVAAQLASLAALAPRRILPVFGLRPATPAERTAYPVAGPRAEVFEEASPSSGACSPRSR
jgi:hypothetical protein